MRGRKPSLRAAGALLTAAGIVSLPVPRAASQAALTYEGRPAIRLANDRIDLTLLRQGAILNVLTLHDDPARVNPLWEPARLAREAGKPNTFLGTGHFPCVDGFGPGSPEEQAAGYPRHGEAHSQLFEVAAHERQGPVQRTVVRAQLPLAQERLTRTIRVVDGENVVYVDSQLENLLPFDRPVLWAEHATIGAPFLAAGDTVVDLSATRCRTRPRPATQGTVPHRLASGVDFVWPIAPLRSGGTTDLREVPPAANFSDNAGCLMDPSRKLGWVTALNRRKQLLFGYVFRTDEFPWLQHWMFFPADGRYARGMEFATMPFDVPRREAIGTGRIFDSPLFRWLPAKAALTASFLVFYTKTPADFGHVDAVSLSGGKLVIEDRQSGRRIELPASAAGPLVRAD